MTKCITINSCRECPYAECGAWGGECSKFGQMPISTSDNREDWPDTIHPDCQLNDVPSKEDAYDAFKNADKVFDKDEAITYRLGIRTGAQFVIDKISK